MIETKDSSQKFVNWYEKLSKERQDMYNVFFNKSLRLSQCIDFWKWDKYDENELLRLKEVNRCKDRFCTNCKRVSLSRSLNKFAPVFDSLVNDGYVSLLVTFTIPNCEGDMLKKTINDLLRGFNRLYELLGKDGKKGLKKRKYKLVGGVRTLEVTYNSIKNTYHPHLHCLFFISGQDFNFDYFEKRTIPGPFRKKSNDYIYFSQAEIEIMQLWKVCFDKLKTDELNRMSSNWIDLYMCNIQRITSFKGVKEVFKYTFKDLDIKSYEVFKNIYDAILGRRLRSSLGLCYTLVRDLDCEEDELEEVEKIEKYLTKNKKEEPKILMHNNLKVLRVRYTHYKKISLFGQDNNIKEIIKNET